MSIDVKSTVTDPKIIAKRVSAVDSEKLIAALDKLGNWVTYTPVPDATPKFDKSKKVESIVLKVSATATLPDWAEYSKSTTARKAEWDKMKAAAKKYIEEHHDLIVKHVKKLANDLKSEDLDKAKFDKLWKTEKAAILKVSTDHARSPANGGLKLAVIGPDPIDVTKKISSPSPVSYAVGGKTLQAAFLELKKRPFWGRYRSNGSYVPTFAIDGKVSKITIKASPVITMPIWSGYSKGNAGQKASWDAMWTKLNKHENNHHDIFVTAVDKFAKDIENKDLTKAEMEAFWKAETKGWQGQQDAYDSKTNHGVNEGVQIDWSADP